MSIVQKEVTLSCGSIIKVESLRNVSDQQRGETTWLPYVSLIYTGETFNYKTDEEIESIEVAIQLRSLDDVISLLTEIREELKK